MVVAKLSCTETSIVCSSEVAMVAFLQLPWEKSLEAIFLLPPVTICLLLLKQLLGLFLFVVGKPRNVLKVS